MPVLKVSVSGVRGIWPDSLNLSSIFEYVKAFGYYLKKRNGKKVIIGRDARITGKMISNLVSSILNAMGIDVIDCGIVPTPTVLYGVRKMNLDGGIVITASHNPIEWNALKFVKKSGLFTGEADMEEINNNLELKLEEVSYNKIGLYEEDNTVSRSHIDAVLENCDSSAIKNKHFRVVLDPVNSAGSKITQNLLNELNCDVKVVNGEMNGNFGRGTEPTVENLKHLSGIIRDYRADIGFAQDPDADRLVLIDEKGIVLSEEYTLALALENILSKEKGDVVINLSTSNLSEFISEKYGRKCYRTKVGEANVVEGIMKYGAAAGGEGNGGVIYPRINCARDSLAGIAMVLELMAVRGKKLSELIMDMPSYLMIKEKIELKGSIDLQKAMNKLVDQFKGTEINNLDGIRLDWNINGHPVWIHLRSSNTEPVIRIIGEILFKTADDKNQLNEIFNKIKNIFA